ncbi:MAG: OsmC family protein [Acidobacteriia bacterium]|nr:OsmC family protein [Terriglobia bacterium]
MLEARCTLTQPGGSRRQFVVTTGSNHHLIIDDPNGATGPKPVELVAAGHAGCTAFDVINILRKKRQQVTAYEVRIEVDQAPTPPQVFTDVRIHHVITGLNVDPAAVEDAIRLSEEKYCSVGAMVKQTAHIHTDYQILQETGDLRPLEHKPEPVGSGKSSG